MINKKSLKTLEYYKITEQLSNFASSLSAKQLCKKLIPATDFNEIIKTQKETSDACYRIQTKGSIAFNEIKDIKSSLKRLEIDSYLTINELLNISSLCHLTEKIRKYGIHEDESFDSLEHYFRLLTPLKSLTNEIDRCIVSENTISDTASFTLNSLRKKKNTIQNKIHSELNTVLNTYRNYLMESVITMRGNSYCIPIKSEYKNKVAGIIHDQSSTGSTIFIEPLAIIKMNNEIRELEILENKEIEKIIYELSKLCTPYIKELSINQDTLITLDFIFAKANYSKFLNASEPEFNQDFIIDIKDARHPLLDKNKVVPINIRLGKDFSLLIITGPNTGGKTVCLKTVGLFTLMGQAGLHIPAFTKSKLCVFKNVFADIGDEQSIEQNLSTFSSHMTKIVEILDNANKDSLCLFDELGAGTDPTEGAALAISILSSLHKLNTLTIATTHYSELKVFALNTPNVCNACLEFDMQTLKPTYKILIGIPGKSNAFAISKKLGLSDDIIENAKNYIQSDALSFEDLLSTLEENRISMEKDKIEIQNYKNEIEKLKNHYKNKEESLNKQKEKIINDAKEKALEILSTAKETADESIKNINKIAAGAGLGKELEKERERLRSGIKNNENQKEKIIKPKIKKIINPKDLQIGDIVLVNSLNMEGSISSKIDDKGYIFVQMGILRSKVNIKDISFIRRENSTTTVNTRKSKSSSLMKAMNISPEINVISMTVFEACSTLDKYLDDALLSHLKSVKIIHGRGTGALQKGIHEYLKKQSFIKEFHLADFEDGGNAITIVHF